MNNIILDTETTGLTPHDRILQLSIIDAESGETILDRLYKPEGLTEWPESEKIHHISPEMVKGKPNIMFDAEEIEKILYQSNVIGYNVIFDLKMLKYSGITVKGVKFFDLMRIYTKVNHSPWMKLSECAWHYGLNPDKIQYHNALSDCIATRHIYLNMKGEGVFDTYGALEFQDYD